MYWSIQPKLVLYTGTVLYVTVVLSVLRKNCSNDEKDLKQLVACSQNVLEMLKKKMKTTDNWTVNEGVSCPCELSSSIHLSAITFVHHGLNISPPPPPPPPPSILTVHGGDNG